MKIALISLFFLAQSAQSTRSQHDIPYASKEQQLQYSQFPVLQSVNWATNEQVQHYFRIFLGQLPYFWTPEQLAFMLHQVTGVYVISISKSWRYPSCAFVSVATFEEKQNLLSWNKRLVAEVSGFWILSAELLRSDDWDRQRREVHLPFGAITIEEPRQ